MTSTNRFVVRLVLFIATAGIMTIPETVTSATGRTEVTMQQNTFAALPQMRIRKLHLVRPDLIFYPMAYEIVC